MLDFILLKLLKFQETFILL